MSQPDTTKPSAEGNALAPIQRTAGLVETYAKRIVKDDRAQQFSTAVLLLAKKEPKFMTASQESLMTAMMACVHLDLMPNTPEQRAYLIPYSVGGKMEVQFQLGYKGMIELAFRSGRVKSMSAELVFDGDVLQIDFGTERRLAHHPSFDVDRTDYKKVTHAYATATLDTGEVVFEVMGRKELDKVQESAKAKSTDSPWAKWPEAMAKKTAIKRLTKLLPSSNLQLAAQLDSLAEAGKLRYQEGEFIEGEVVADDGSDRKARMAAAVAKRKELEAKRFNPASVPAAQPDATVVGDNIESPDFSDEQRAADLSDNPDDSRRGS